MNRVNPKAKISIVTPTFNQADYIEETILSVLEQGYENLEYIIIDGGSTDRTVEIIKKYENHLKAWVSEPDQGQSDAINKGLSYCTGEIFNWLNSDDLLEKDALEVVSRKFEDPNINLVSGKEIHFSETGSELKWGSRIYEHLEENIIGGVIYQPSTFWRLEILKEFLPLENLNYLMDTDLWIKYFLKTGGKGIEKVEDVLARFRLHPGSKTVQFQNLFQEERWILRKQLFDFLRLQPSELSDFMGRIIGQDSSDYNFKAPVVPISYSELLKRYVDEIAYYYYVNFDYKGLKQLFSVCRKNNLWTSRTNRYFLKLNFIPRRLLNAIRS